MHQPLRIPVKLSYHMATGFAREDAKRPMAQTVTRTIRVTPEQWERIEKIAGEREGSANRLVVEFAMEALDRREWPRTEAEIHVARASMFAALALQRDLAAAPHSC